MLRRALCIALLASLAACASKPLPYGNFVAASPDGFTDKVTADMVTQLVAAFPPASTRLNIQHPTADAFGIALVEGLRTKGYALQEFTPAPAHKSASQADIERGLGEQEPAPASAKKAPGSAFSYVVDGPIDGDLYRVTMTVGTKSFSRAYALDPKRNVIAASAWTRKD